MKIILVSYFFSSKYETGGIRAQKFAKYLPTFGLEPIVITRKIKDPYGIDGRCVSVKTLPINWPFHLEWFTWIPGLFVACLKIIRREKVPLLLFSCGPFPAAIVGVILKRFFRVKLILDYRDYWTLSPYVSKISAFHRLVNHLLKPLERLILKWTDRLILIQREMEEQYLEHFPFLRGKTEVIFNGFDEEDIPIAWRQESGKFTISYVGNLHLNLNPYYPILFLECLQKMKMEKLIDESNFQAIIIGERFNAFEKRFQELGLAGIVKIVGRLPHPESVQYLVRSHLLLLIVETDGIMTSKIFEYLATGRPVLALIKPGELMNLIQEFSPNSYIVTSYCMENLIAGIQVCLHGDRYKGTRIEETERFRNRFNRRELTKQLVRTLRGLG